MQAVREVETGRDCAWAVQCKYGILGNSTVMRWVRQLGRSQHGKIIRVETPDEIDETARLRTQLRRAKEALADAHMDLALEMAFLAVACEQMDQSVERFKQSTLASHAPGGPSRPRIERGRAVRVGPDDAQNYYARRGVRSRQDVDLALVLALVKAEREQQPRLGGRKLYHLIAQELKAAGVKLGRDRLFVELGRVDWLVPRKPAEWPKTTQCDPNLPVFKNLIRRCLATGPNQVWVAGITYIRTREVFLYLGLITDQWSRKIVGYHLGRDAGRRAGALSLGDGREGAPRNRAADPPLEPWLSVCVARLRGGRAKSGLDHEHDRAEPQRGECPVRKLLHRLGYSVQRPTTRLVQADPLKQNKWIRYTYPNLTKSPGLKAR